MLLNKLLKINSIKRKDGSKLSYLSSNINKNKETIVFINGWGNNRTIWEDTFIHFIENYNIIIYEPPGHGLNEIFIKNSNKWTMEDFSKDLHLIIKNIKNIHLIGHSIGGMISQQYVSNKMRSKKVKSMVLINSEYKKALEMLNLKLKNYVSLLEKSKFKFVHNLLETIKKLKIKTKQNPNYVIKKRDFIIEKPIILFLESSLAVDYRGSLGCLNAMKTWRTNVNKPKEVFNNKIKTLVIFSEKDMICDVNQSKEIIKYSNNVSGFNMGPKTNHNSFFTKGHDKSIEKIKNFLN